LYIADYGNNRIVVWEKGAESGQVIASTGSAATGEQINRMIDIAIDSAGAIWFVTLLMQENSICGDILICFTLLSFP
jgi:sugar lactone lactonase YvrE